MNADKSVTDCDMSEDMFPEGQFTINVDTSNSFEPLPVERDVYVRAKYAHFFEDLPLKSCSTASSSSVSDDFPSSGMSLKIPRVSFDKVSKLSKQLSTMSMDDESWFTPSPTILQQERTTNTEIVVTPPLTQRRSQRTNEFNNRGVIAVSSSKYHQADPIFGIYAGVQCMIIASTAAAYSVVKQQMPFESHEMTIILKDGTATYASYLETERVAGRSSEPRTLYAHEVPTQIRVGKYNVELQTPEWVHNGLFPANAVDLPQHVQEFSSVLHNLCFNNVDFDPSNDRFLFTFQGYTVSFWKDENNFFLFNSHAVGLNGTCDSDNPEFNRARLFQVNNLQALAKLLLIDGRHHVNNQYEVNKLHIVNYQESQSPCIDMFPSPGVSRLKDDDCVMIMSSIDKASITVPKKRGLPRNINLDNDDDSCDTASTTSTSTIGQKKRGRPCKVKRGPKKQKLDPHAEAQAKYVKNKPDAQQEANQKYYCNNPNRISQMSQYKVTRTDQIKEQKKQYTKIRSIPVDLRKVGLICELSGDELDKIKPHSLKKPSLQSGDINKCSICGAKLFHEEVTRTQWCCGQGRFNVIQLPPLTEPFYDDPVFIDRARVYNNMYAFSALQTSGTSEPLRGGHINFIRIQGRTYHKICDLSCTTTSNNLSFYVYDENERYVQGTRRSLNKEVMIEITHFLHDVNPYIEHFKRLSLEPSNEAFLCFQHTTRTDHGPNLGSRVANTEVAAIVSCDESEIEPRAITVWKTGEATAHTVPIFDKLYEPLHYTLLYPHGNTGWYLNMPQNRTNTTDDASPPRLSLLKYTRHLLLSDSRFSELGRLSEEWQVDMICRILEERLNYIKAMQGVFRTAPLNELVDADEQRNVQRDLLEDETIVAESGVPIPGRIYLPNTFTGGPRYMTTKYFDAIALVNRIGRPSYFLTFTCNPSWPEIVQSKKNNCYTSTLIVARVFKLKLVELIKDLKSGQYLGEIEYLMYVIEYQKRGLPHAHICFRVKGGGPTQNTEIDRIIRADIPSETEAGGRLRKIVLKHMIHGPCDPQHFNLPCFNTEKDRCERYFPKQATDVTYIDNRGFVNLKRNPDNVATITHRIHGDMRVSDLWVVPYNPTILLKYDSHVNLEISSTRKIVKYLFKYITKGPDLTRVAVVNNPPAAASQPPAADPLVNNDEQEAPQPQRVDEIEEYVTKRYIGSCEAVWRLLSFELTEREPFVQQLPVHLEGQQSVIFKKNKPANLEDATSKLLTYFRRPLEPEFDNITYMSFYEQYMLHAKRPSTDARIFDCTDGRHFVTKRTRRSVSRLYWATPKRGELYYLRMMLEFFPCRSYNDLYALGGPDCTTFQEAARNLGIADDEQEYARSLQEASGFYTGRKLRHFFVLLITNGAPGSILWEHHKQALSEDFLDRLPDDEERAYHQALCEIDRLLRKQGSCASDHGLPEVQDDTTELGRERVEFESMSEYLRLTTFVDEWLPQLSVEQLGAFDHVRMLLHNDNYKRHDSEPCIFIQGCSGSGKTLLLNLITAYVRGPLKKVAICVAASGIAALNHENGTTAHTMFKLPIELTGDDTGVWGVSNSTQRAELIREAAVIIYDEAPMAHKHLIHMIDRSLRDLMDSPRMFGGKIVILAGDFRQIPPVVPSARCPDDIVRASLLTSPLWQKIHKISLVQAQRTRSDNEYSEFLLKLGSGLLETFPFVNNRSTLNMIRLDSINTCEHLHELIDFVFPEDILSANPDECAARAILTTHNVNVKNINSIMLNRVEGDEITCFSADSVETELAQEFHLAPATLNQVENSSAPNHELRIKKGCVCMIIRNLSFVDRLVNGTKVIIVDATPRIVTVRKPNSQELYPIPRISFKIPIEAGSPIEMTRLQFPLQISYAMTVHKSQGQTIDRVGVDLRSDVFAHGQLYVALGRVRNRENILVLINRSGRTFNNVPHTNNVIIKRLLI